MTAHAHGATGTATGVSAARRWRGLELGASFTNVPGGTANWTFTDATGNYNDASGSVAIVITKADATVDGHRLHRRLMTARRTARPARRRASAARRWQRPGLGRELHQRARRHGELDVHRRHGNYNDESGTVAIVINKADATVSVTGYTGVYDGAAHGATGTATGVGGAALSGLELGDSFTNVPGGTANWTFTGGTQLQRPERHGRHRDHQGGRDGHA